MLWLISHFLQVPNGDWRSIGDGGDIVVSCIEGPSPRWCRVQSDVRCRMPKLQTALTTPDGYLDIFKRIEKATWVEPGVVHIQMSMPLLFQSRDYISVFQVEKRSDEWQLIFSPAQDHSMPQSTDVVRLDDYRGLWSLRPKDGHHVSVSFFWNSDYKLPTSIWSRDRVRRQQGEEIMSQLKAYCKR